MLKYDKLKLLFPDPQNNIEIINPSQFNCTYRDDILIESKYHQTHPYYLDIKIDHIKNEMIIEFTSKILLQYYSDLISRYNMDRIFNEIQNFVHFKNDISKSLKNIIVLLCHCTIDVNWEGDMQQLLVSTQTLISNNFKWKCQKKPNGFTINNTAGKKYYHYITVYDKEKETQKSKNRQFTQMLRSTANSITDINPFANTLRIELNITNCQQIRELLKIENTDLHSVLHSTANPILTILNEALVDKTDNQPESHPPYPQYSNIKEYHMFLTLQHCNWNIPQLENKIRSLYSPKTHIKKIIAPYREYYRQILANQQEHLVDIRQLVQCNKNPYL